MKKYLGLVLSLVLASSLLILTHNAFLLNDFKATVSTQKVQILIESGDTGFEIANKLADLKVIKMAKVFYKIALNDSRSKSIAPGIHEIDLEISSAAALDQLLDSKRIIGIFGFSEGLRKGEILHDDENDRQFHYENKNYKLPWEKNEFLNRIINYQKKGVVGFVDNNGEMYRRMKNSKYNKFFDSGITLILIKPTDIDNMEKTWKIVHNDIVNNL